jgi:hypothetical protein
VRVSEIDLDTGRLGENFVAVHLAALVVSHGLAHRGRLAIEHGWEAIDDGLGGGIVHFGEHHEAGNTFDERADRWAVAGAFD